MNESLLILTPFVNLFDRFAVIFILCFSSVLFLSFVRNVPAKFSIIRIIMSTAVAIEGVVFCENPSLTFMSGKTYYTLEFSKADVLKSDFSFYFYFLVIIMAAACAGALLMTDLGDFRYNILPIISYQLFTIVLKIVISEAYNDYLCSLIFEENYPKFTNSFWYCCIAIITVIVFLILLPESSSTSRLKVKYTAVNLVVLVAYIVINYLLDKKNVSSNVSAVMYILSLVVVFVLMCYLMKFASAQSNYIYAESQEHSEMKSVVSHNERNEDITKYLHDLPKHLDIIQSIAFQNGEKDLADYIRTLTENYHKARTKFTSGNTTLDELLRLKRVDAEKNNAEIIFSGVFPEHIKIKDNDLRTVFSNAIDNALKNCRGAEKQNKIRINSKIIEDSVVVTVLSIRGSRNKFGIFSYGSDFSRLRRRIIESTVRDYDGAMKWEIDDSTWKLIFSMKYK